MYICLCNGLTDRDIKSAVASGAERIANVYESLGAAPQCAKCTVNIRDIIRETISDGETTTVLR
ncbi:(2Fe-2S)-binding protein [Sneathiella litorea]|uniref:Bacterioferritin-associated ferredoxin n=1 Tax=Sneathiella litorea TaxID=2606216 RepID=A0A6L8W7K8_9PROT|nr:(2Fe-2S)-binding protein [Sneathiella litorea]MZR30227.1 (2Fe-2S)-binding protein [Sneathiella litorea]